MENELAKGAKRRWRAMIEKAIFGLAASLVLNAFGGYYDQGMFRMYEGYDGYGSSAIHFISVEGASIYNSSDGGISVSYYLIGGDIVLPSSASRIQDGAFKGFDGVNIDGWDRLMPAITSAYIPDSITKIGNPGGGLIFYGCNKLKSVRFPASVSYINTNNIFYECSSLQSVELPIGTTSIGVKAFYGCSSLKSVTLPSGVTYVGESSFAGCSSLGAITLPDTITNITTKAFSGCRALTEITLPDGLTKMTGNGYQFENCTSLKKINFGKGLTSLSQNMFNGCTALTEVELPDGVATGSSAFSNCPNIRYIRYTSGIGGDYMLSYICPQAYDKITKVVLNTSSTKIYSKQFKDCAALKEIEIPEGVESVANYAFENCASLTSLIFPSTITSFGSYVFKDCSNLKSIKFLGNSPFSSSQNFNYIFSGLPSDCVVYFPKGATGWTEGTYSGIKVAPYEETSRPAAIESASEDVKTAFDAWAEKYAVSDPSSASVDAFILNLEPSATEEVIIAAVNDELKAIDFAALMSGNKTAALSEITSRFPNAKVEIEEVNEGALKCTDNTKFYRLKLSIP